MFTKGLLVLYFLGFHDVEQWWELQNIVQSLKIFYKSQFLIFRYLSADGTEDTDDDAFLSDNFFSTFMDTMSSGEE